MFLTRKKACLHNCLSAGQYQPKGESSYCFRRQWWQWQGQAKESQWPHHPDPPAVTSNAWIPETKADRHKQRWALSKRSSQSRGQERAETEEVLCQECDREYQRNSYEEDESEEGGSWGGRGSSNNTAEFRQVGQGQAESGPSLFTLTVSDG